MRRTRLFLATLSMFALLATLLNATSGPATANPGSAASTRIQQASGAATGGTAAFAKSWAKHANKRKWKWIRAHSRVSGNPELLRDVRWFLRNYGKLRFGAPCSERYDYDDDPKTKVCYGNMGENLLVKRKSSHGFVAVDFWVED